VRIRDANGRKVVSTDNAETVGKVEAFLVDPRTRSIAALRLAKVSGDAVYLSWEDLRFGSDAVVVASSDRLRPARDDTEARLASKDLQPVGKLVLDDSGTALGKVEDVEFDPTSGAIVELDLGDLGRLAGDRLIGLGSYAVVVARAPYPEPPV
jgi:sporulation protein YlmC with PRC-barrel domain